MLIEAINYRLMNQYCFNFVHTSKYGDQTHCENPDCVCLLEIGQASYVLNHPRMFCTKTKHFSSIFTFWKQLEHQILGFTASKATLYCMQNT